MSQSELQRFLSDLRSVAGMADEAAQHRDHIEEQVRWANERGYHFTFDEVEALVGSGELSDEELEEAAGGWDPNNPPPPPPGS
ncbi:MAG TPA: Nif11-like leader peptide family RiPP precursor [Thermoanaerobaculia bacterium]|jgi:predicted ribosomally synthesized peptide with nif11-like leader|nr:Nif11-like leader peptide family RiPP precursor [Thermoanaerobaculia bacterium]